MILLLHTNHGKTNLVVDALPRCNISTKSQFLLLTTPLFEFLETLSIKNKTLSNLQAIHKKVQQQNFQHPILTLLNGIIYYKVKPFLRKDSSLKTFFAGIS